MAQKKVYNVPLRKNWIKVPKWRRSKRASNHLKEFLIRHTKSENVKIGRWLNEAIWKHGGENPPGTVKVKVTEDKEGNWNAELFELSTRAKRIVKKKEDLKKKKKKKLDAIKKQVEEKKKGKTKEDKKEKEENKKKAKITKKQEMSMNK